MHRKIPYFDMILKPIIFNKLNLLTSLIWNVVKAEPYICEAIQKFHKKVELYEILYPTIRKLVSKLSSALNLYNTVYWCGDVLINCEILHYFVYLFYNWKQQQPFSLDRCGTNVFLCIHNNTVHKQEQT